MDGRREAGTLVKIEKTAKGPQERGNFGEPRSPMS